MREGQQIYDSDTHCSASAEALEPYLSAEVRGLLPNLDEYKKPIITGNSGRKLEAPYRHRFAFPESGAGWFEHTRVLGEAEPRAGQRPHQSNRGERMPTYGGHEDPGIRLQDMDEEGTDVHLMVPTGANGHDNPMIEMEFIRAQHRWLSDFCSKSPSRLKSLVIVTGRSIQESVKEIHTWGSSSWAVGIQPYMPLDYPIDHPDMDPIWTAAQEENLAIVHHSFQFGYPGYRDLWRSPFLGRSASHPWAAMRFVGATVGAGLYDRFPDLRFAVLESGFGWIPWWASRLDEQTAYVGYVSPQLKHRPSEYLMSGRFFCSLELHEGAESVRTFIDRMGPGIIMMGSDYPHAESRFPESIDQVLSWKQSGISASEMAAIMWDNPVRLYGSP